MTAARTYIDIHILQTLPPSNINRDDAGSPKTATYGGVLRSRVSSQAWKRATRTAFAESLTPQDLGTRTKRIAGLLTERLSARSGLDHDAAKRIAEQLTETALKIKAGTKEGDTAYLLFFGRQQLERIVDLVADDAAELSTLPDNALTERLSGLKGVVLDVLRTGHPVDVALFGRMVADIPSLNVDAATQVAHALSTHATQTEFDYFTAVDDENTADETGAGMIGNVEFTSSTLYRYATIALHQLAENLAGDDDIAAAVTLFVDSFARSIPSGHQNSFAHRTLPSVVSVAIRTDQPVNLVGAFEQPVRAFGERGIAGASLDRLADEALQVAEVWGATPERVLSSYAAPTGESAEKVRTALGDPLPFPALLTALAADVSARLADGR
jgi:CRISPR system Cascade subunit CasC